VAAGLLLRQVIAGFKKKARAAILGAVAGLGHVRLIGGKLAINILPEGGSSSSRQYDKVGWAATLCTRASLPHLTGVPLRA
jgi:hypothetical protein